MHKKDFCSRFWEKFPFLPTFDQQGTLENLSDFLFAECGHQLFLLKGYAGSGKTSLMASFVDFCCELNRKVLLLAPTGRSAKVFSSYSSQAAFTIHKKIYKQQSYDSYSSHPTPAVNLNRDTLFIVDEASLISNAGAEYHLLDDLIEYVYSGDGCRLILMGDDAQLPPVGESASMALSEDFLKGYGFDLYVSVMTQVVRQAETSGVMYNATLLRSSIFGSSPNGVLKLDVAGFKDLVAIDSVLLLDELESAFAGYEAEENIVITRSNKRAVQYNIAIRNRILYREEMLSRGDILMVSKNDYFWCKEYETLSFLANGEMLEVMRVRGSDELYGLTFVDLTVRVIALDIDLDVKIIVDALTSDTAALPSEQQSKLYEEVMSEYDHLTSKSAKYKELKKNPYFNALHVKYGYAVTCHKAQGGQWKNVFVDMSNLKTDALDETFYRWLYTALTRTSGKAFLINVPELLVEGGESSVSD